MPLLHTGNAMCLAERWAGSGDIAEMKGEWRPARIRGQSRCEADLGWSSRQREEGRVCALPLLCVTLGTFSKAEVPGGH